MFQFWPDFGIFWGEVLVPRAQWNENGHQSIEVIIARKGTVRDAFVSYGQFDCSCRIQWWSAANLHLALWLLGYLANTCPRWIGLSADGCTQARSKRFWARLWVRPLVLYIFGGGRDSARFRVSLRIDFPIVLSAGASLSVKRKGGGLVSMCQSVRS